MSTIATAEVQLIPSLRGGAATIAKELGGTKAGEIAGKDIATGLTPQIAEAGKVGGIKAGDELRAGLIGSVRGLGSGLGSAVGIAGREAGEVGGSEAGLGFGERFKDTIADVAKPLLAFFAADKVVDFFKESIEAGEEAEKTSRLIEIQLKNTGEAAGISMSTVDALATTIGKSAGIAQETILDAEQALLKFAGVGNRAGAGNDIFSRATQDAADLAAVMKTDVPSAAALLGKALNNPTAGLSRLTRAGVAFNAQQLAQIKAMTASGNLLGAQKIILDQFETQFAGAAAGSATASDRFRASISDLKDAVGEQLMPVVADLTTEFETKAIPVIDKLPGVLHSTFSFIESNKGWIEPVTGGLLAAAAAYKVLTIGSGLWRVAAGGIVTAFRAVTGAIEADDVALASNPIGLAAEAVGALAAGLLILNGRFRTSAPAVQSYTDALQAANGQIDESIKLQAAQTLQNDGAVTSARAAGLALTDVQNAALGNADAFSKLKDIGQALYEKQQQTIAQNNQLVSTGKETEAQAQSHTKAIDDQIAAYNKTLTVVDANRAQLEADEQAQKNVTALMQKTSGTVDKSTASLSRYSAELAESRVAARLLKPDQDALAAANKGVTTGLSNLNAELQDMETNYFEIGNATDAFESAVNTAVAAFTASKTGAIGTSDAAIAARAALEGMVTATANVVAADAKHHDSAKQVTADFDERRAALVKLIDQQEKAGKLTTAQGDYYLDAEAHVPGAIKTQVEVPQIKQATAKANLELQQKQNHLLWHAAVVLDKQNATDDVDTLAKRLTDIPKKVNVAVYAQGTKNAEQLLGGVNRAARAIPGAVDLRVNVALNAAAYEKQLVALEKAGGSPLSAAQSLKNRATIPHFAIGGPVRGPGGPTADDVLADLSNGEDVVNAAGYARNRRVVDAINAGATVGAAGSGAVHVRVFIGSQELTDIVRTEVDSSSSDVAGYVRYRAA